MTELTVLLLNQNVLSGTVPTQLGDLVDLESLSLSDNSISGALPTELGRLVSIEGFFFTENMLCSDVPTQVAALASVANDFEVTEGNSFGTVCGWWVTRNPTPTTTNTSNTLTSPVALTGLLPLPIVNFLGSTTSDSMKMEGQQQPLRSVFRNKI